MSVLYPVYSPDTQSDRRQPLEIDSGTEARLRAMLGDHLRFHEPMSRHTSLRVGGPADLYAAPEGQAALSVLMAWAAEQEISCRVIGGGTNLLVSDAGLPGMVVALNRYERRIDIREEENGRVLVSAGAGVSMSALCRFAARNRLEGMAFAVGIPGTVGGGIRMNAGTATGAVADVLAGLTVLDADGQVRWLDRPDLRFCYRHLAWPETGGRAPVILTGHFRLRRSERTGDELQCEIRSLLAARWSRQPKGVRSAGCFFKNPSGHSAGALIDRAGLKGLRIGGAMVSPVHANFIVNRDGAAARDILSLAEQVRATVLEQFGVALAPEVRMLV